MNRTFWRLWCNRLVGNSGCVTSIWYVCVCVCLPACMWCGFAAGYRVSFSHVGFFSEQQLVYVGLCRWVAASLQPFPVTLHEGERHLLAALGATARVRREVVPHGFSGTRGEAESGLGGACDRVHLGHLQSRIAGQPRSRQGGGLAHNLPSGFGPPAQVELCVALPEEWQRWAALLVERGLWRLLRLATPLVGDTTFSTEPPAGWWGVWGLEPRGFGKGEALCGAVVWWRAGRVPLNSPRTYCIFREPGRWLGFGMAAGDQLDSSPVTCFSFLSWSSLLVRMERGECSPYTNGLYRLTMIILLTPDLSSSSFSKLSCWVRDSLRSFFSQEFGWRPLQLFKVPQLSGSLGGELLGLVRPRSELTVKDVGGPEVDSDPEEASCVLAGCMPRLVTQVWSPLRESREERVGAGEMGVEEDGAVPSPCSFNPGSSPGPLLWPLDCVWEM